jgi:hypothetical protein
MRRRHYHIHRCQTCGDDWICAMRDCLVEETCHACEETMREEWAVEWEEAHGRTWDATAGDTEDVS